MAFDAQEFVTRFLSSPPVPARRQNKNRSGRTGNRQSHTRRDYSKVGGKVSWVSAVYNGNDRANAETADPVELCYVVNREIKAVQTPGAVQPLYRPQGTYSYQGRVDCV